MSTKTINIISGPGAGKTVLGASLFAYLKMQGELAEFISEYAKTLVWTKEWELLNNQHHISYYQYKQLKQIDGEVDYIVLDSSLLLGAYYGFQNPNNVTDPYKVENMVLHYMKEFDNFFIFVERNPHIKFEKAGRVHDETESKKIDTELKQWLDEYGIDYITINNEPGDVEYIYKKLKET